MMLVPLVPWPEDKPQRVSPRHEPLTYADPTLSYALQHADETHLWAVARAAVRIAAAVAGLSDDPTLLAVIDGSDGTAERAALDQMARELEAAQRWPSFRAVEAARSACGPNAMAAAFRAVTEADRGVRAGGADPATLRDVVMAVLDNPPAPAGSGSATAKDGHHPWDRYSSINDHWLGGAADVRPWTIGNAPSIRSPVPRPRSS
jgi:hypothetical protein